MLNNYQVMKISVTRALSVYVTQLCVVPRIYGHMRLVPLHPLSINLFHKELIVSADQSYINPGQELVRVSAFCPTDIKGSVDCFASNGIIGFMPITVHCIIFHSDK
jgi:hypothetical protein